MRLSRVLMFAAALSMVVAAVPALAQGRGAGQRPPKVTSGQAPKGRAGGQPATRPPNANRPTDPGGANRAGRGRSEGARGADGAGRGRSDDARGADGAGRGRSDEARGANGADRGNGSDRADQAFVDRIAANPEQKARLEAMLPSGMTLAQAAEGFRNQGQFIAALENSKNLNIPFASLKTEMVTNELSLGQAIQKLKPETTTTTTAAPATP